MDFRVHSIRLSPKPSGVHSEGKALTIVYSAECKAIQKANRTGGTLPILIILFVVSYGLLASLVIEQGKTIDSQRGLIRDMLKDSNELALLKGKLAHDESARAQQQPPAGAGAPAQAGQQKSPSAPKGSAKDGKQPGKPAHSTKEAPGKPPSDLEDVRRATRII